MGFPMDKETKPFSMEIIEYKSWVYLILLIIIMFFIYVLNIEIVDYVYQKGYEWWNGLKDIVNPKSIVAFIGCFNISSQNAYFLFSSATPNVFSKKYKL